MKIIVNILLTTVISLSFIACEDKKEFKDTLKIEKEKKVKLEKPKWERKLLLAYEKTEEWFEEADDSEIAAYNIANIYSEKIKDKNKAIEWHLYSDSIKSNSSNLFNMGITFTEIGDYNKSIKYYKESFNLGHSHAASNLAALYEDNLNDLINAEKWYKIAISKMSIRGLKGFANMQHSKLKDDIKASAYLINLTAYPEYAHKKEKTINYLKNKWKLSDETIKKGYELQLTMPGLPKRYTGGI